MKVLVINAGSSSLKYQLLDTDNQEVLAKAGQGPVRAHRHRRQVHLQSPRQGDHRRRRRGHAHPL